MFDINTLKLIDMLNAIQRKLGVGCMAFSDYDEDCMDFGGIIFDGENLAAGYSDEFTSSVEYPIVLDSCVTDGHHDIISYYDDVLPGLHVHLCHVDDEGEEFEYVSVKSDSHENFEITVDRHGWSCRQG